MTMLDIIKIGDARLRKRSKPIRRFDDNLKKFAADMVETMRKADGVGLAAPQVGVNERFIVVEMPKEGFEDDPQAGQLFVLVNPEIVRARGKKEPGDEGCLSIPGYIGEVMRHTQITVKGQNLEGKEVRVKAFDFLARAFQHEIDHLDGVLFIDHIDDPEKLRRIVHDPETDEWYEEPAGNLLKQTLP